MALIVKDPSKKKPTWKHRPNTCFLFLWKTIAEKLYDQLKNKSIIADEQKSCLRFTRDIKDHLLIDKAVYCKTVQVQRSIWL